MHLSLFTPLALLCNSGNLFLFLCFAVNLYLTKEINGKKNKSKTFPVCLLKLSGDALLSLALSAGPGRVLKPQQSTIAMRSGKTIKSLCKVT